MPFSIVRSLKSIAADMFRGAALWQELQTREVAEGYRGIVDTLDGKPAPAPVKACDPASGRQP